MKKKTKKTSDLIEGSKIPKEGPGAETAGEVR